MNCCNFGVAFNFDVIMPVANWSHELDLIFARMLFQEVKREEVRDWVLAVSMDHKVSQTLPLDERETFECNLRAHNTGMISLPCVVTGKSLILLDWKLWLRTLKKQRSRDATWMTFSNKRLSQKIGHTMIDYFQFFRLSSFTKPHRIQNWRTCSQPWWLANFHHGSKNDITMVSSRRHSLY